MKPTTTFFRLVLPALLATAAPALAQGPSITFPNGHVFKAGPDYATDVLHDPWDFSNIEDLSPHPDDSLGWTQSGNARTAGPAAFGMNGQFSATSASGDPMLGLLYAGTTGSVPVGRTGLRYPIDSARYRKLSFKMNVRNGSQSTAIAYWFLGPKPISGNTLGGAYSPTTVTNGDRIYQIDFDTNSVGGVAYPRQGHALGLRLDPTADNGALVDVDWVRLTSADGSPESTMTLQANGCSGAPMIAVNDAAGARLLEQDAPNLQFNYGVLPPGGYSIQLRCGSSSYSAARSFTINDPPQVTVVSPSETSGADYATTVLNNPWDYADVADIPASANVQFLTARGGQLHATSAAPAINDPQLFFLNREGAARPIASTRYRYLTFSLGLNAPFSLDRDGSMARTYWASTPGGFDGTVHTVSGDILIWPGMRSYTIDLTQLNQADHSLGTCPSCQPWAARSPRYFRLDPHEFVSRPLDFVLGTVKLTAPAEVTQGGSFQVRWQATQAGANSVANVYLDRDRNPGGETLIGSVAAGAGVLTWQANAAPGDYYVLVQVVEPVGSTPPSNDVRNAYSTGVLRVISAANNPVVTIATHASGGGAYAPFAIAGCAYNGATGAAADEVYVYAHPLQGQMGGTVQLLGYNAAGGLGTASAAACASGPGYQISNLFGLAPGQWTFRTIARNPVTGDYDEVLAQNVNVQLVAAPPRNLRVSTAGNRVTLAWDPPAEGSALTQYRIESTSTGDFANAVHVVLPPSQTTITATLLDGRYVIRVRAGNQYSTEGAPSNVIDFRLPGGVSTTPPGPVTLTGRLSSNPISLTWSQAGGGAATYTLIAGTVRGGADVGVVPMGGGTAFGPLNVPVGARYFARVVATNSAGSTMSNEVEVHVPAPGPPGMPPVQLEPIVSGRNVTLRWNPPADGSTPTAYGIVARIPGTRTEVARLYPVSGTALHVPGVPPGSYDVVVVGVYGSTVGGESNTRTVVVVP